MNCSGQWCWVRSRPCQALREWLDVSRAGCLRGSWKTTVLLALVPRGWKGGSHRGWRVWVVGCQLHNTWLMSRVLPVACCQKFPSFCSGGPVLGGLWESLARENTEAVWPLWDHQVGLCRFCAEVYIRCGVRSSILVTKELDYCPIKQYDGAYR